MTNAQNTEEAIKILLVDDTPANIDVLRKTLEPHKGAIGLLSQPGNGSIFCFILLLT